MRTDVSFDSRGLTCKGWLFTPDSAATERKLPIIIMAHGFSGVKEMGLAELAEKYANAGYAVLLFDYRFFGSSEGEPRGQLFPLEMVEDYRNAISWACEHPEIDPHRIGLWGTSYSGGLAVYAATYDKRVKAVVVQAPSLWNGEDRSTADPDRWDAVGRFLQSERSERYMTGKVGYIKVVAPDGEPCVLPGTEVYDAYMSLKEQAPSWKNEITIESLEKVREFDPITHIKMMSPAALLVIAAENDGLIPISAVEAAFEKAPAPKKLSIHPVGHFDFYHDPGLSTAASEAIDWYDQHIGR